MTNIEIKSKFTNEDAYVYVIVNKELKQAYVGSSYFNLQNRYNYDTLTNKFNKLHHSNFALDNSLILNPSNWVFHVLRIAKSKAEMKLYEFYFIEYMKYKGYTLFNSRTGDYNGAVACIKEDIEYTDSDITVINKLKNSINQLKTSFDNRLTYMKVYAWTINKIKK